MTREVPDNSLPIIHDLVEGFACAKLSTYEFNIIWAVIRKTYGWDKSKDWISLSQLSAMTGILPNHCSRTLKKLFEKNIFTRNGRSFGINKNRSSWKIPKQVLPKQVRAITQTGISLLPKQVTTKETITKETIQKKKRALKNRGKLESFGEEKTIELSQVEWKKLCRFIGRANAKRFVQKVENWKLAKGQNYKNDYRGILTWISRARESGELKISWQDFNEEDFDSKEDYEKILNKFQ